MSFQASAALKFCWLFWEFTGRRLLGCKPKFRDGLSVPSSGSKWSKTLMIYRQVVPKRWLTTEKRRHVNTQNSQHNNVLCTFVSRGSYHMSRATKTYQLLGQLSGGGTQEWSLYAGNATKTRNGELKLGSFLTAQWVLQERIFPPCYRSENLRVTSGQVIPLLRTVLCRYLYISCASQRPRLSSKDKILLFSSSFSKLTDISHSIIIAAFPLALSKPTQRKNSSPEAVFGQRSVLIPLYQTHSVILLIQPSPLLKANKKKCFGGGLGRIWISNTTRDKALKENPLWKWSTVPTNLSLSM